MPTQVQIKLENYDGESAPITGLCASKILESLSAAGLTWEEVKKAFSDFALGLPYDNEKVAIYNEILMATRIYCVENLVNADPARLIVRLS